MDGGQPRRPKLAYPRRRGIKNPSREAFLVETTTPLPYRRVVSANSAAIADLLNQIAYLVNRLKDTAAPPGPDRAEAEKPRGRREWKTGDVGYYVGKNGDSSIPICFGSCVIVNDPHCEPLAAGGEEELAVAPYPPRTTARSGELYFVSARDLSPEPPAELDPQGEIVPFPTKQPSQPQWDVKFVEGEGLQPAGWEPFAVTDRHIALRRRVQ